MQSTEVQSQTANGDLPTDEVEAAVMSLIAAADRVRARRDELRDELETLTHQLTRYDRAVKALTEPRHTKPKGKPGPKSKRKPGVTPEGYAPGQPIVGQARLDTILDALKSLDHPAGTREIGEMTGISRQSVAAAFAHLRYRGLARFAGNTQGGGHLYAPFADGEQ